MRPRNCKVSIVLATYNEREHIGDLITEIFDKIEPPVEVIVVDDDSKDGTADIVDSLKYESIVLIRRKVRGLASAFHRGIIESTGEIVCWMDADMCMPVDVLRKMIDCLDSCDVAIGSRYAEGGSDNRALIRVLSSKAINGFARFILGGDVKDYDSGFVALKRDVFNWITLVPFGYGEYFIEMVYDIQRCGLHVVEIGYDFRDRVKGTSKSLSSLGAFIYTGMHYGLRILTIKSGLFRGGK